MDMFEKVEKLRQAANVSYEEAKAALEKANGDILDAMIILEREGKVKRPNTESYSTRYEDLKQPLERYKDCEEKKSSTKDDGSTFWEKVKRLFKKSTVNYLLIEKNGEILVKIPILAAILILIFSWYVTLIAMLVSLFFGCKYSFVGEDEAKMKAANDVCNKAEDVAETVKEKVVDEYNKL